MKCLSTFLLWGYLLLCEVQRPISRNLALRILANKFNHIQPTRPWTTSVHKFTKSKPLWNRRQGFVMLRVGTIPMVTAYSVAVDVLMARVELWAVLVNIGQVSIWWLTKLTRVGQQHVQHRRWLVFDVFSKLRDLGCISCDFWPYKENFDAEQYWIWPEVRNIVITTFVLIRFQLHAPLSHCVPLCHTLACNSAWT